jgi:hypothetical protein
MGWLDARRDCDAVGLTQLTGLDLIETPCGVGYDERLATAARTLRPVLVDMLQR